MSQQKIHPAVAAGLLHSRYYERLDSNSAALRERVKQVRRAIAARARDRLTRALRIVDIGAQTMGQPHVYGPLKKYIPLEVIGFDPLEDRIREREAAEEGENVTLYPYAVGDGNEHTFHVNNFDAASSLFPLNLAHNAPFDYLRDFETVRTERIATRRLDDVLPAEPVDFLKLDIQGAELMVLQAATETLTRTATIHCEVEFSPMYEGQPLYPEIQQFLNAQGFDVIDIYPARHRYLGAWAIPTRDRLVWGDAVFFRQTDDAETLAVQALIAAAVYRKPALSRYLLERAAPAIGTPNQDAA